MPPSAGISKSVATLGNAPTPRVEVNMTFFPSGDQPTTLSSALWNVSCFGLPPSADIT